MIAVLDGSGIVGQRPFVRSTQTGKKRVFKSDADRRRWQEKNIGTVPATTTYEQWLSRQSRSFQDEVLGPTRGRLFRTGRISLDKFVDRRGNELTLADLEDLVPDAF